MEDVLVVLFLIVFLAVIALLIAARWRIFQKAGRPGWTSIVPIYSTIVLLEIVKRPTWWILLLIFIPFVNVIIYLLVNIDLAKAFNKSEGFGVGLSFLSFVFYPILGFGDAEYQLGEKNTELEDHLVA
jgi:chromate transport protein ChrA